MDFGFSNAKDILDVLLVPLSAALLAVLWPFFSARKRRRNFEDLVRRELSEAAPTSREPGVLWHHHLPRRFLHEDIIGHPVENTEFLLSLKPEFTYNLSQMWDAFDKASKAEKQGKPVQELAKEFSFFLEKTSRFLDDQRGLRRRRSPNLHETVWRPWRDLITSKYPDQPT